MASQPLPRQLAELASLLGDMALAAAAAMQRATAALLECRERLAHQVITSDAAIDALRARIEEIASEAVLFHAPVAGDLRAVVAAIRAAGDLERMGDLALHIAKVVRMGRSLPAAVRDDFAEMGCLAVGMARKTAEVVSTRNVILATELEADDDAMDRLHRHVFTVLLDPEWPHGVAVAVDLTLLARYYERFADHAVLVARETVYAVTGGEPEAIPS
jgi:phosphate transport system protein